MGIIKGYIIDNLIAPLSTDEQYRIFLEALDATLPSFSSKCTITVNPVNCTVTGDGACPINSTCVLTATPNDGYVFVGWYDETQTHQVSTQNPYSFVVTTNVTLTAVARAKQKYTVTPVGYNGSVSPSTATQYTEGDTCTLTFIPNAGYHFTYWKVGQTVVSTQNPYTFTVDSNITVTGYAQQDAAYYDITANNVEHGVVTGTGSYRYGDSCTLTFIPDTGYRFVSWADGSTDNPRIETVTAAANYDITGIGVDCVVTLDCDSDAGSVAGAATYHYGDSVTCTFYPNTGYEFKGWYDETQSKLIQSSNPYVFTITGDVSLYAVAELTEYTLSVTCNNASITAKDVAGNVLTLPYTGHYGDVVVISISPNEGYEFLRWSDGGITDNPRTVSLTSNLALQGYCVSAVVYNIYVQCKDGNGTTTGSGRYAEGDVVTISCTPNAGHTFGYWEDDASTVATRTVTVYGDFTYVAVCPASKYQVTVDAQNGTAYGAGWYDYGEIVTIYCVPFDGYYFSKWSDGNTHSSRSFTVYDNFSATAICLPSTTLYNVTVSSHVHSTVNGDGPYASGESCTLTCTPDSGYAFVGWYESGVLVSSSASYTFTVTASRDLTAECAAWSTYDGLTFTSTSASDGLTKVYLSNEGSNAPTCQYSVDGGTNWTNMPTAASDAVEFGIMWLRGPATAATFSSSTSNYSHFVFSNNAVEVSGDASYLIKRGATQSAIPADYCFYNLFENQTLITSASGMTLPSTTLKKGCYEGMFSGCTALIGAPVLPATNVVESCYQQMFKGCESLTTPPALPSTVDTQCYYEMFSGCYALNSAPALSASVLAPYCYYGMFKDCKHLVTPPTLSASTLDTACYAQMFKGCTRLASCPALNATTLKDSCYLSMFEGCTTITSAPTLVADDLVSACYRYMFSGCSKLNYVVCEATDISATNCTDDWLSSVASSGNFYAANDSVAWAEGSDSGIPSGWTRHNESITWRGLTLTKTTSTGSNNAVYLTNNGSNNPDCLYSFDNVTWSSLPTSASSAITIAYDAPVYLKGTNASGFSSSATNYSTLTFTTTTPIEVSGNITSLINPSFVTSIPTYSFVRLFKDAPVTINTSTFSLTDVTTLTDYCFYETFKGTSVTSFKMPTVITTIGNYACYGMFEGSTLANITPGLPASTVGQYGYASMFKDCTSFTTLTANILPATTATTGCYQSMFEGCENLVNFPKISASALNSYCYYKMFMGCTNTVQHATNPLTLSVTTVPTYCYANMFEGCEGLVTAPDLPASTLTASCYYHMFNGCTNLNAIKCLATDISATACTSGWTSDVAATGTFTAKGSYVPWVNPSVSGIPDGWTVVYDDSWTGLTFTATSGSVYLSSTNTAVSCEYSIDGGTTWVTTFPTTAATAVSFTRMYVRGNNGSTGFSTSSTTSTFVFPSATNLSISGDITSLVDRTGGLTTLPATYYFKECFKGCPVKNIANLDLHAVTVTDNCYQGMFEDCTSLTTLFSSIVAENLGSASCANMFKGCSRITSTPALPASTLTTSCYGSMFEGCSQLTTPSALGATTLATQCYAAMFKDCTALVNMPTLSCTDLVASCYMAMFSGCTALSKYVILPAETLKAACYAQMFYGCTSLNHVIVYATTTATGATLNWLAEVASSGTLEGTSTYGWESLLDSPSGVPVGWTFYVAGKVNITTAGTNCTISPSSTTASASETVTFTATHTIQHAVITSSDWVCSSSLVTIAQHDPSSWDVVDVTMPSDISSLQAITLYCTANYRKFQVSATATNGTVTIYCNGSEITSGTFCTAFSTIRLVCTPDSGYTFTQWSDGSLIADREFSLEAQVNLTATCSSSTYLISFTGDGHATLTGGGNYVAGDTCTLTVKPNIGYVITDDSQWSGVPSGATFASDHKSVSFTVTQAESISVTMVAYPWAGLCFVPASSGTCWLDISNASSLVPDCEYSLDYGATWTAYPTTSATAFTASDVVYVRGTNTSGFCDEDYYSTFKFPSGSWRIYGAIMSLIDGVGTSTTCSTDYCFRQLFAGTSSSRNTNIKSASGLTFPNTVSNDCFYQCFAYSTIAVPPTSINATSLNYECYGYMFQGCTSLTSAPALPAETLANSCYIGMFQNCTQLASAPALPAKSLKYGCYREMFTGCIALTTAPSLPATTLETYCYYKMFSGCNHLDLTSGYALGATVGKNYCYYQMFYGCSALSVPPTISLTSVGTYSCYGMFQYCTTLTYGPNLSSTVMQNYCYAYMFYGCKALVSPPALSASTLASYCYQYMFAGASATSLGCAFDIAPELRATNLVQGCYQGMFAYCTKMTEMTCYATSGLSTTNCTDGWVVGVGDSGVFYDKAAVSSEWAAKASGSGIPDGWAESSS